MTSAAFKLFIWITVTLMTAGISACADKEPDAGHEGIGIYSCNPYYWK